MPVLMEENPFLDPDEEEPRETIPIIAPAVPRPGGTGSTKGSPCRSPVPRLQPVSRVPLCRSPGERETLIPPLTPHPVGVILSLRWFSSDTQSGWKRDPRPARVREDVTSFDNPP